MSKFWLTVFVCFVWGCEHPESKKFTRDKGVMDKPSLSDNRANQAETNEVRNVLEMETEHGVRYVWIEVNGIKLRFVFDTGASSICLSPTEVTMLYRQGTLQKEDILDKEYFRDATGRISKGTKINLRTIKVGNVELQNVKATVIDNVNAPLLLGQSALERFGSIEIDNKRNQIILR